MKIVRLYRVVVGKIPLLECVRQEIQITYFAEANR